MKRAGLFLCAWVLWARAEMPTDFESLERRVELAVWQPVSAYSSETACVAKLGDAALALLGDHARHAQKIGARCLPDTIDPRGVRR